MSPLLSLLVDPHHILQQPSRRPGTCSWRCPSLALRPKQGAEPASGGFQRCPAVVLNGQLRLRLLCRALGVGFPRGSRREVGGGQGGAKAEERRGGCRGWGLFIPPFPTDQAAEGDATGLSAPAVSGDAGGWGRGAPAAAGGAGAGAGATALAAQSSQPGLRTLQHNAGALGSD